MAWQKQYYKESINRERKISMKKVKAVAAVTSAVVLAASVCACGAVEENTEVMESISQEQTDDTDNTEHIQTAAREAKEQQTAEKTADRAASGKEETVYVNARADGSVDKVIVSEWLKNPQQAAGLSDRSGLENIMNVKGTEGFTKAADGSIVWDANGSDIYYQGESSRELPVSMKITYFLNGKEMKPEDMAGKSGHVKMRIDYENHTAQETDINGKTETICTPFLMTTGVILPTDTFTNVEAVNAKIISDGNRQLVIGMAFPGLAESLQLEQSGLVGDKTIPDYVEISADAEHFALAMTATVATTGTLSELGIGDADSLEELQDSLQKLSDASSGLVEGSSDLFAGTDTLKEAFGTFTKGLADADSGMEELKDGIDTLDGKKGELVNGVNALASGISVLQGGAGELKSGIDEYTGGVGKVSDGASSVNQGAAQLKDGINTLNTKKDVLINGVSSLNTGAGSLKTNLDNMRLGIGNYTAGVAGLEQGIGALKAQIDGAVTAASGSSAVTTVSVEVPKPVVTIQGTDTLGTEITELQTQLGTLQESIGRVGSAAASLTAPTVSVSTDIDAEKARACEAITGIEGLSEEQVNAVQEIINGISVSAEADVSAMPALDLDGVYEQMNTLCAEAEAVQTAAAGIDATVEQPATIEQTVTQNTDPVAMLQSISRTLGQLQAAAGQLSAENETLTKGMEQLSDGAGALADGAGMLNDGASELKGGIHALVAGADSLQSGTKQLQKGTKELKSNGEKLKDGAAKLQSGSNELLTGSRSLSAGAGSMSEGIGRLADGAASLKDGTAKLVDGSSELATGIGNLQEGAGKLSSGMAEFDEDGISALTETVEGDFKNVLERLKAVVEADKEYHSFEERMDGTEGSVKFIIETGGIGE